MLSGCQMTSAKTELDKGISDIFGALTDPIIVMPGGWGESLPDWIKTQISLERLIENIKGLRKEGQTGTDAEACAYLYTASLTNPMGESWTRIYLYVAGKCIKHHSKNELPEDIKVETLSDYDTRELNKLKAWIYEQRIKARKEKEKTARREMKNKKEVKQPDLFYAIENDQMELFKRR